MKAKQIHEDGGQRTFALVFDAGDEVVAGLTDFVGANGLDAASFTAIGAFGAATLGPFDSEKKEYERTPVREQVEVLSLLGNVATKENGRPLVHAHAVLGASDGSARGGHLLEARVRPALEVVLVESPARGLRAPPRSRGTAQNPVWGVEGRYQPHESQERRE